MLKSSVISGEASETDSDDEILQVVCHNKASPLIQIQGAVITGEDSESDNENAGSVSSAVSALAEYTEPEKPIQKPDKYESLLHKKLREANSNLYTDIETFVENVISNAGKELASIDQQLLKSQITLQNAVTTLKCLNSTSALIKDRLNSILTSKFIYGIKIE